MAEPKDTTSFFRKVVKFVANPATDWTELDRASEDARESDYAKGELKAMIERKRRNDFVRKREFDMLRKVRREGLSSEQLAALGGSSRLDDSEAAQLRQPAPPGRAASRPRSTRSSSRWSATATPARSAARPSSTTRRTQPVPIDMAAPAGGQRRRRRRPRAAGSSDFVAAGRAGRHDRHDRAGRGDEPRHRRRWSPLDLDAAPSDFGQAVRRRQSARSRTTPSSTRR